MPKTVWSSTKNNKRDVRYREEMSFIDSMRWPGRFGQQKHACFPQSITHRIHGAGIFTYIYHRFKPNVGKYTIHGWYGLVLATQVLAKRTLGSEYYADTQWPV